MWNRQREAQMAREILEEADDEAPELGREQRSAAAADAAE
jgi:hypothetical protein